MWHPWAEASRSYSVKYKIYNCDGVFTNRVTIVIEYLLNPPKFSLLNAQVEWFWIV